MPSTPLYDRTGKTVGNVELSAALFDAPVNTAVLHQVVTALREGSLVVNSSQGGGSKDTWIIDPAVVGGRGSH